MLQTKRLILRRWKESDAEDLYEYAKDPDVGPIAGWPPHTSVEESREIIRNVFSASEAYAVCLKENNKAIGAIELKLNGHTDMTERDDECELGYWIGKPYWGQGLIPEAAMEMIRHGFEDLEMRAIWCGYYEGNEKSKRVQEKCGFRYQWTTENVDVPLMKEKRTGHVSLLTRDAWNEEKKKAALREQWQNEEDIAHIEGWDFSHIHGRYTEETDLPWDYEEIVRNYLTDEAELLDFDTGGGEFLLSLRHPHDRTSATEGYPPNIKLCRERLEPLGIRVKECSDASQLPFEDGCFDIIINRHGDLNAKEIYRVLRNGGVFITEQVGGENDHDLVEMVLPGITEVQDGLNMAAQTKQFEEAGIHIVRAEEAFRPIEFYDIGAFVWFARIIEWEFPGFSVENNFEELLKMQAVLERDGKIAGTIHRYLIVASKEVEDDVDK